MLIPFLDTDGRQTLSPLACAAAFIKLIVADLRSLDLEQPTHRHSDHTRAWNSMAGWA